MPLGGGFYYVGFFYVGHSGSDSARISDKGSPANLVGARWLNNRNAILRTLGRAGAKLTPASARRNDGGHVGDVGIAHMAATAPIAVMGCTGHLMAYVVDADVPAPLGGDAPETLGAHLDFCQRIPAFEASGADIPPRMGAVGHYILNAADFPGSVNRMVAEHFRSRCTNLPGGSAPAKRCDARLLLEVTPEERTHPAGRGRPPLSLHCLERKPFEEEGLRPGGKVFPFLRVDRVASSPDSNTTDCPDQAVRDIWPCGHRDDLPIHNAHT